MSYRNVALLVHYVTGPVWSVLMIFLSLNWLASFFIWLQCRGYKQTHVYFCSWFSQKKPPSWEKLSRSALKTDFHSQTRLQNNEDNILFLLLGEILPTWFFLETYCCCLLALSFSFRAYLKEGCLKYQGLPTGIAPHSSHCSATKQQYNDNYVTLLFLGTFHTNIMKTKLKNLNFAVRLWFPCQPKQILKVNFLLNWGNKCMLTCQQIQQLQVMGKGSKRRSVESVSCMFHSQCGCQKKQREMPWEPGVQTWLNDVSLQCFLLLSAGG